MDIKVREVERRERSSVIQVKYSIRRFERRVFVFPAV